LANTKSAIKRMRQNERRRLRNRAMRSKLRGTIKTARGADGGAPLVAHRVPPVVSHAEAVRAELDSPSSSRRSPIAASARQRPVVRR